MRRHTLPVVFSAVVLALTAVLLTPTVALSRPMTARAGSGGWAQSGYDGAQSAYNSGERQLTPTAAKHLTKKWSHPLPGTAIVRRKSVYVSVAGGVRAYSAANGHPGRLYKIHGAKKLAIPGLAIADGSHLIVADGGLLESVTFAADKSSWRINLHDTENVTHRWSPIVLSGSTLYTVVTTSTSSTSTSTTKLMAIAASTGHVLWSKANLYGPLAVAGGRVFANQNGTSIGPGSYIENLVALSATTGSVDWTDPQPEIQYTSDLAVSGTTLLVAISGQTGGAGGVFAFSTSTGDKLWTSTDTDGDTVPGGIDLLVDGSVVVYASANGHLIALRVADGHQLWRGSAINGNNYNVVGGDGVVYDHDAKNRNAAYRISSGKLLWHSKPSYTTPILVADGRLLIDTASFGSSADVIEALGKR